MLSIRSARRFAPLLLPALLTFCGGGDGPTDGTSAPTVIQMVGGNDQSATIGSSIANPLVVEVLDARGRAVGGQSVAWSVVEGNGTLSAPTSVTNASGEARTFLQFGSTPGLHRVRATLGTLSPVSFSATALPRAAGRPEQA